MPSSPPSRYLNRRSRRLPAPRYLPGILTDELGWVWRYVAPGESLAGTTLHLMPTSAGWAKALGGRGRTACGRRITEVRLAGGDPELDVHCEVCVERNGGRR